MVRTKAKPKKGDDAFTTRKQKVGRKKLEPATATRAEVHAQTLRISTPSRLSRGSAGTVSAPPHAVAGGAGAAEEDVAAFRHGVQEALVGTRHYKPQVRASAFKKLAAVALSSRNSHLDRGASEARPTLSPLESLEALSRSLEGLTESDDDVRSSALQLSEALLKLQSHRASGATAVVTQTKMTDLEVPCHLIVQAVVVCLTHALGGVRKAGVELLQHLLRECPAQCWTLFHTARSTERAPLAADSGARVASPLAPADYSSPAECMKLIEHVEKVAYRSPQISVLADFLEVLLAPAAGPQLQVPGWDVKGDGGKMTAGAEDTLPARVVAFFEKLFVERSSWATWWRELMELRLGLFRDVKQRNMAIHCARCVSSMLLYLNQNRMLQRSHVKLVHDLFIHRIPFTVRELAQHGGGGSASHSVVAHVPYMELLRGSQVPCSVAGATALHLIPAGVNAARYVAVELTLAGAIANVCVSMSNTEEGFRFVKAMLEISLGMERPSDDGAGTASRDQGSSSRRAASPEALLSSLLLLKRVLLHFPQRAPRVMAMVPATLQIAVARLSKGGANGAASSAPGRLPNTPTDVDLCYCVASIYSICCDVEADGNRNAKLPRGGTEGLGAAPLRPALRKRERACDAIEDGGSEALEALQTATLCVPRLLFAARRFVPTDAAAIAATLLWALWRMASSQHPAVWLLTRRRHPSSDAVTSTAAPPSPSVELFARSLQSMFGLFDGTPERQKLSDGILDVCPPEIVRLGVHVCYYLNVEVHSSNPDHHMPRLLRALSQVANSGIGSGAEGALSTPHQAYIPPHP